MVNGDGSSLWLLIMMIVNHDWKPWVVVTIDNGQEQWVGVYRVVKCYKGILAVPPTVPRHTASCAIGNDPSMLGVNHLSHTSNWACEHPNSIGGSKCGRTYLQNRGFDHILHKPTPILFTLGKDPVAWRIHPYERMFAPKHCIWASPFHC